MRCYAFLDKNIVDTWLKLFETIDIVEYSTTQMFPEKTKLCYGYEDFIYTFYRSDYDTVNYKKAWLHDNFNLTHRLASYLHGINYSELCMLELIVPDDVGQFGELGNERIIEREDARTMNILIELVLPYLHKNWIVEYYTFDKLPKLSVDKGIEIIPHGYNLLADKLIYTNAPLVWDTSDDTCDPLSTDTLPDSDIPFEEYRIKCRQAFYEDTRQKEETNLF